MNLVGPIIIIEDDPDDQEVLKQVVEELQIKNPLRFFSRSTDVIHYLVATLEKPFLILSDINLPGMNGIELKKEINKNAFLRKKAIPFVFYTTSVDKTDVDEAYQMMVQGYFQKEIKMDAIKQTLKIILDYWHICRHPNNF